MSDHFIIFIPEMLGCTPSDDRQTETVVLLKAIFPLAECVEILLLDEMEFFDCGANFESAVCPCCKSPLRTSSWQDWMDIDFQNRFEKLSVRKLSCCGNATDLHSLTYVFPQGFAKFAISVTNPNAGALSVSAVKEIEAALGCDVRIIYKHL